jgi:hypothetical protein
VTEVAMIYGSQGNAGKVTPFRELLLESARPDLYRRNAFRVLGLPVHVTERELQKRFRRIQLRQDFGGGAANSQGGDAATPLPLTPGPAAAEVAAAHERLERVEGRFIDEFFWLWSSPEGAGGEALAALVRNDVENASRLWVRQAEEPATRGAALHDLAVMFHAAALDIEWASGRGIPVAGELGRWRDDYWQNAIGSWLQALAEEQVWHRLEARVEAVDDPRLTRSLAGELREALPVFLLTINARLAAEASQRGASADAKRYAALMLDFGFEATHVEEARRRVIEPAKRRIYDLCQALHDESVNSPESSDEAVSRMLEFARPLLLAVDNLLPAGDPLRTDALDAVADAANRAAVAKGNSLPKDAPQEEWESLHRLFKRIARYPVSPSLRGIINRNLARLSPPDSGAKNAPRANDARSEANARSEPVPRSEASAAQPAAQPAVHPTAYSCWFCGGRDASARTQASIRLYQGQGHHDVKVPRCGACRKAHLYASVFKRLGQIVGGGAVIAACIKLYLAYQINGELLFGLGFLLVTLVGWVCGLAVARMAWALRYSSAKRKPVWSALDYRAVRVMLDQGWVWYG